MEPVFENAAEEAVELFEESDDKSLKDVLNIVKQHHHLSKAELVAVQAQSEKLLTWEMLEPERSVDVC
jgi:hypothetical protein